MFFFGGCIFHRYGGHFYDISDDISVKGLMSLALDNWDGDMESNSIMVALRREKILLEQVFCLAICQLDLVQAGRLEDLEISMLVREERMKELAITEANINAKMPDIENDPTISPAELAELHYLNLQITGLTDSIVDMDERAQLLVELCDSGACFPKA